jgi:SAM-dependent methyltransferase
MFYKKNKNSEPFNWLIHHYCILAVEKYAHLLTGDVLDIGCGEKPYQEIITKYSTSYIGLESKRSPLGFQYTDIIGDALNLPFEKECFDNIVAFQVMEHIPEPELFLKEINRVIKRGGYVLLTTPFMWGEHDPPFDYFRYTRYGLKYLAEKCGFEVVIIQPDTKFWSTWILRFNYYFMRFGFGPLKYIILPITWLIQFPAYFLDKIPHNYTIDTATFTTVLRKK